MNTGDAPTYGSLSGAEPAPDGAAAISGLVSHIQGVMEHQKALLARELHDELGGLLVGAVMDLAWAEQHLAAPPDELKQKLLRARQTLAAAIDMKRKLIEELRPTLLDNVGLFAALRWHVQAACKRAAIACVVQVPADERRFLPNTPIALFRIVQEALAVIVARKPIDSADFRVTIDRSALTIRITSIAAPAPAPAPAPDEMLADHTEVQYLAAIDQRVCALNGRFQHQGARGADTLMTATFPLAATLAPG